MRFHLIKESQNLNQRIVLISNLLKFSSEHIHGYDKISYNHLGPFEVYGVWLIYEVVYKQAAYLHSKAPG